jgi:hypothetical protein
VQGFHMHYSSAESIVQIRDKILVSLIRRNVLGFSSITQFGSISKTPATSMMAGTKAKT